MNSMQDWPLAKILKVSDSETAPAVQRAAARCWLDAMSKDRNAAGSPIAGSELDRIMDRTQGKPTQAVDVTSEGKSISFAFVVAKPDADPDQDPPQAG
jgi:hypothetical protein